MRNICALCLGLLWAVCASAQQFHPAFDEPCAQKITDLAAMPGDSTYYFTDGNGLFRADGKARCSRVDVFSGSIQAIAINPANSQLAVATDGKIERYDTGKRELVDSLQIPTKGGGSVRRIVFEQGGQYLAVAWSDYTIQLFDATSGSLLHTYAGHHKEVTALAFSLDGKLLVSGSGDKTVRVWDIGTGRPVKTLVGHQDWVRAVAVSPDSLYLASAGDDRRIYIWDLLDTAQNRYLSHTEKIHQNWISALQYIPDGKLLSVGHDNRIVIWYSRRQSLQYQEFGPPITFAKDVERQAIQLILGPKHDAYIATLGSGILANHYFQLRIRAAHPVHIDQFNGREPDPHGYFTMDKQASFNARIARLEDVKQVIVRDLNTHAADTISQNFSDPMVLDLPNKANHFQLEIMDNDPKIPAEYFNIVVYRAKVYPRWLDELFDGRSLWAFP